MTAKAIETGNKKITTVSEQASIMDSFIRGVHTTEMQKRAAGIADNINRDFPWGANCEQLAYFEDPVHIEYIGGPLTPDHPDFEGVDYVRFGFGRPWFYYPSSHSILVQHEKEFGVAQVTEEAATALLEVCYMFFYYR